MRRVFLSLSAAAAVLALSSCGGGSSPAAPSSSGTAPITITITGENGARSFEPNPASAGGRLVVFRNNDVQIHRVTLNDGTLDTGDIAPGATSRALMMPATGTNYHCSLHPTMVGSVNASSGGGPPPCQGPYC
jgi:plastocyanin